MTLERLRLFSIKKRITIANNGDILSISEEGSDVYVDVNRDISVWKGSNFPSVFYFPIDKHLLIRNYRDNAAMFAALDELVKSKKVTEAIDTIEIIGACSPVGSEKHNLKLALNRCLALRSYLRQEYLQFAERYPIKFNLIGIDKLGYDIMKEHDPPLSEKQIWDRLQYAAIRLKMKDDSYIILGSDKQKTFFYADTVKAPEIIAIQDVINVRDTVYLKSDTVYITTTEYIRDINPEKHTKDPLYLALKTNLLYDAALLPNLAVEWYMGKQWSLLVEGNWSWWTFDRPVQNRWFHRVQSAGIELRHWFKSPYPLHGHAVGIYSTIGNYDIRLFTKDEYTKGDLSYLSWSAGLSYAYSFPIARKLNLELGLSVGYVGGKYYKYDYCTIHNHWAKRATYNRKYVGPTRVGVSLVWLLGTGNKKKNKSVNNIDN